MADEMDRKDFLKKGWMGLLAPFFQEVDKENDWLPPGDALAPGRLRFNEMLRQIGDVSRQMLSRTLKQLEQDGFITRTAYPEVPPRVEYALTDLGRSFQAPMGALVAWADEHHRAIVEARQRYLAGAGE